MSDLELHKPMTRVVYVPVERSYKKGAEIAEDEMAVIKFENVDDSPYAYIGNDCYIKKVLPESAAENTDNITDNSEEG